MGEYDVDFENPYRAPATDLKTPIEDLRLGGTTPPVAGNPWVTMWTQPRGTIRHILNTDPNQSVTLLICLAGFAGAVSNLSTVDFQGGVFLILVALVIGPLASLLAVYINSHVMKWSGEWVGGQGSREEVRAALAWAFIPGIASGFILLSIWVLLAAAGTSIVSIPIMMILIGLMQIVFAIWGGVISIRSLAEAHRIGAWKMFGGSLLFGIALILIIIAIVAVIGGIAYFAMRA